MHQGQANGSVTGVYVIYRNRMVGDAVQAVLRRHAGISVLGATDDPDLAQAGIVRLGPDVILLEETSDGAAACVQALLSNPVPCRLVTLCLDRDGMHVWSQEWWANIGPDDLVEAIVSANEGHPRRDAPR